MYCHHKHGLLEDIPHVKLLREVIIVAEEDAEKVLDFLREYKAEIHVRRIVLTSGDKKGPKEETLTQFRPEATSRVSIRKRGKNGGEE